MMIRIVTYEPQYKQDFIQLNKQWMIPLKNNAYERCDILMELCLENKNPFTP